MDLFYVGFAVIFFGLAWALVKLCERLMPGGAGTSSHAS